MYKKDNLVLCGVGVEWGGRIGIKYIGYPGVGINLRVDIAAAAARPDAALISSKEARPRIR